MAQPLSLRGTKGKKEKKKDKRKKKGDGTNLARGKKIKGNREGQKNNGYRKEKKRPSQA